MSCNTYLATDHTPFTHFGRTGNSGLRSHNGMRTYFIIVCYLYQIV